MNFSREQAGEKYRSGGVKQDLNSSEEPISVKNPRFTSPDKQATDGNCQLVAIISETWPVKPSGYVLILLNELVYIYYQKLYGF